MSPNPWPWSLEEEEEWEKSLRKQEFGWMEEMIEHMVKDGFATSSYDPFGPQDDWCEEEEFVP